MKNKPALIIFAILTVFSLPTWAEIVVIANPTLPVSRLTRDEIYRIYLGKTKFLSNGVKVIPVDQKIGSSAREEFYSDVIRRTDTDMKAYWSRVIFTGQGYPPIQESDNEAVKDLVAKNPNCIGYIDSMFLDNSVKVIFTIG